MKKNHINIIAFLLIILQVINPLKVHATDHKWLEVPKSEYGSQVWDQLSFQRNQDGSIRVLSKFIPKTKTEITKEILYTMDIDCSAKTFRDVYLGQENFNEFKNPYSNWKDPNGDKLIVGVISQVCRFKDK